MAFYMVYIFTKFKVCIAFRLDGMAHFLPEPYMAL